MKTTTTEEADTRKTVRLLDALDPLRFGCGLTGETPSAFIRRAVKERVRRITNDLAQEGEDG